MQQKKLWFLALISVLVTVVILSGTSYASLDELIQRDGHSARVEDFLNSNSGARQTGAGSSTETTSTAPVGRQHIYARNLAKVYFVDGSYEVYGIGNNSAGVFAGSVNPLSRNLTTASRGTRINGDLGWFVIVYYLGTNGKGDQVFQINIFNPGGVLVDDGFVFTRNPNDVK